MCVRRVYLVILENFENGRSRVNTFSGLYIYTLGSELKYKFHKTPERSYPMFRKKFSIAKSRHFICILQLIMYLKFRIFNQTSRSKYFPITSAANNLYYGNKDASLFLRDGREYCETSESGVYISLSRQLSQVVM